jgi:zinc transport system permease protein
VSQVFAMLWEQGILQRALLGGLLASIACGVVGSYVTVRRITYIAGAIAHCTLGGIGAAMYLSKVHGWSWCTPLLGAAAAARLAALLIGFVTLHWKQRADTVLSAVWSVGMAAGIIFIFKTPGYNAGVESYLFGDVLYISRSDLLMVAVLDVLVVLLSVTFYNQLLAVCFDEEHARISGINVNFYYMLLMVLTALSVVLLIRVVGIIMLIALLALPAGAAGQLTARLSRMMLVAVGICALCTSAGTLIGIGAGLPPGAVIVISCASVYVLVLALRGALRRMRSRGAGA